MNDNYSWVPVSYMVDGVKNYIEKGREPGCFLQAVLKNDLRGAVEKADHNNKAALTDWVHALYNNAPWQCWGSPAAYKVWVEKGGLGVSP